MRQIHEILKKAAADSEYDLIILDHKEFDAYINGTKGISYPVLHTPLNVVVPIGPAGKHAVQYVYPLELCLSMKTPEYDVPQPDKLAELKYEVEERLLLFWYSARQYYHQKQAITNMVNYRTDYGVYAQHMITATLMIGVPFQPVFKCNPNTSFADFSGAYESSFNLKFSL